MSQGIASSFLLFGTICVIGPPPFTHDTPSPHPLHPTSCAAVEHKLVVQAHSMDEVVRQAGTAGTAGNSDRAATVAWRLFEPMQFGMSAHPKVFTTADQGLAESISGAMCEMTNCAEMAMLWTEVYLTKVLMLPVYSLPSSEPWLFFTSLCNVQGGLSSLAFP